MSRTYEYFTGIDLDEQVNLDSIEEESLKPFTAPSTPPQIDLDAAITFLKTSLEDSFKHPGYKNDLKLKRELQFMIFSLRNHFRSFKLVKDSYHVKDNIYAREFKYELYPEFKPECDCGASHTSNKNLHASWCSSKA